MILTVTDFLRENGKVSIGTYLSINAVDLSLVKSFQICLIFILQRLIFIIIII